MRSLILLFVIVVACATPLSAQPKRGVRLGDLTWVDAAKVLDSSAVVVIPLGAESKEHGPQLTLKNDALLATYYTARVERAARVVIAPAITYSYYPAFVDYAGSTTLRLETARDMILDVVRSIARHGPRRFYILNTGVSTVRALRPAVDSLAADGILMRFSNGGRLSDSVEKAISKQDGGTHADEIETSMLLYMYPQTVQMRRAAKDFHPGVGGLTPDSVTAAREGRTWSRSGIFGDATLATREKGRAYVEAHVRDLLTEIEGVRTAPLPRLARVDTTATKLALMEADRTLARGGTRSFLAALEPDAVVEFAGVDVLRGAAAAALSLDTRYGGGSRYAWSPAHAIASSDGSFGCTTGFATYLAASDTTHTTRGGSYITCWRRGRDGNWRIVGHQRSENAAPASIALGTLYDRAPHSATEANSVMSLSDVQDADAAFAAMGALPAGPGPAFAGYAAADAMFPGRLPAALGPVEVASGFKDYPAARVLKWAPTRTIGAAAGGLAFTIGDATTELRAEGTVLAKSHYFTVWRREPDGRWRWILDLGSPRP